MRTFRGDLSSLSAGDFVPFNCKPFGSYAEVTDDTLDGGASGTAAVPATAVDGDYKLVMDYRPKKTTLSVTLDGVAAGLVEFPLEPSGTGVVGVDYLTGTLQFHADDIGALVVAEYEHYGSVVDMGNWNQMQKDVDGLNTAPPAHTHDDRYYTETEVDTALATKAASTHSHSAADIISGTLADARLSSNICKLDTAQTHTAKKTFNAGIGLNGASLIGNAFLPYFYPDASNQLLMRFVPRGSNRALMQVFNSDFVADGTNYQVVEFGYNSGRTKAYFATIGAGSLSALPFTINYGTTVRMEVDSNGIGFFGTAPVAKASAPTAANASAVNSGDATTDTVINNIRTRLNETITKLQSYGLFS